MGGHGALAVGTTGVVPAAAGLEVVGVEVTGFRLAGVCRPGPVCAGVGAGVGVGVGAESAAAFVGGALPPSSSTTAARCGTP